MSTEDFPNSIVGQDGGRKVVSKRHMLVLLEALPTGQVELEMAALLLTALSNVSITEETLLRLHMGLVEKARNAQDRHRKAPTAKNQSGKARTEKELLKQLDIERE